VADFPAKTEKKDPTKEVDAEVSVEMKTEKKDPHSEEDVDPEDSEVTAEEEAMLLKRDLKLLLLKNPLFRDYRQDVNFEINKIIYYL